MSDYLTIKNRIEKNYKHKAKWAKRENIEAYRLYDRDIPDFPYIIDIYKDEIVIYEKTDEIIDQDKLHHFDFILDTVSMLFNKSEDKIILKSRFKKDHQKEGGQYEKLENKNELLVVNEHQAKFYVNLHDYIDTGLFLDHRPLRQIVFREAKDKKVLNLFSYTGSISVFAALGGAKSVTSVDLSSTYQEWARKNFTLNNISLREHNFIIESALDYLPKAQNKFDLIICDPPTFSNSKSMGHDFEVEEDQLILVNECMRLLNDDGVLYFSTNKRKFKINSTIESKYLVANITPKTIPQDYHDQKIHHCFKIMHKRSK
jgi:23S rRNA (cytosine1962-C5)-methyltransferase/23S rRNA (guanine2445-N2)-methyltransferase / 23S rRNA (guanine2069-N7)-methyltransferase